MKTLVSAVRGCDHLFFRSIEEPRDNALRIVVDATQTVDDSKAWRAFSICWWSYIAYTVLCESYSASNDQEQVEGRLLVKYQNSRFLDYVSRDTWAKDRYPGQLTHWGLICASHIVHVVTTEEPEIEVVPHVA
jgi:hypothetical protein